MCFGVDGGDANPIGEGMIVTIAGVTIAVITFAVLLFVGVIWCQCRYII